MITELNFAKLTPAAWAISKATGMAPCVWEPGTAGLWQWVLVE